MAAAKSNTARDRRTPPETPATGLVPIRVGEAEILVPRRFVGAYLSGLLR